MKTVFTYISYIGLILAISFLANLAHAENLCSGELKPYFEFVEKYDGSDESRREIISFYHGRKAAVYSVCGGEQIRQFEMAYKDKIGVADDSQFEKMSFYPKARKTVDLGEIEARSPASRSY